MPKIPSRPTNSALLLPGMGNTTAHTGEAGAKLYTLDPLVARNEVLSAQADPLARARTLTAEPVAESTPPPTMVPRLALGKLLHGAARVMGFARGEPVAHEHLLRYAGTKLEPGAPAGEAEGGLQKTLSSFISKLAAEQRAMDARIAVNQVAAATEVVAGHLERTEGEMALFARRVGTLSDRAHQLSRQGVALAAELATTREEIALTRDVLTLTRDMMAQERQALAAMRDAPLPGQSPIAGTGMSPLRDLLSSEREHAQRSSNLAALEEVHARKSEVLSGLQARALALEQRQQGLQAQTLDAQRIAGASERDLWDSDRAADQLRSHQAPLQRVGEAREGVKATADAQALEAVQSFAALEAARCRELLEACPGFAQTANLQPLRDAVQGWSRSLPERLARFGGEALPMSLAINMAFEALSVATGGHALHAAELVHELQALPLAALVSQPGGEVAASAFAQRLARLLADEGAGLQMLELLLGPAQAPLGKAQAEAARLYLLADEVRLNLPEADAAQREWVAAAQRAARSVTHAAEADKALAACSPDERAAYRAFRNGYDSTAPGSDYDKANQHLKKPLQWLTERAASQGSPAVLAPSNPLNALRQAMAVGAATALPTPARQAAKALEEAAAHLNAYLAARAHQLPAGHMPSQGELAWQAIAYHVQWRPEGSDLTTMKLDTKALQSIEQHRRDLQQFFEREARARSGGQPIVAGLTLDSTWQELRTGRYTVLQAMNMLQGHLPSAASPGDEVRVHDAVARANRLLRDGNPTRVTSARALFDMTRDMIENLEWRDRLRITGQKVWGANTGPLSGAVAAASLPTGVGLKLNASVQHNSDQVMEIYMGRTGLYLQLGEQQTLQGQLGAGANFGYVWSIGDEAHGARAGLGGAADWKARGETGLESGVQLRVLRLSKGQEPELMARFMDVYEHLMDLTDRAQRGEPVPDDWMHELLACHDNLNIGLIDNAVRNTVGTETNGTFFAGARLGEVDDRPRRVNLSVSGGFKARQDKTRTETKVAGYMTTLYRDSTAQTKVEGNVRATAGVMLKQWSEPDDKGRLQPKGSLSAAGADLAYAAEVRAEGITRFCTLFTIDKKIDPVRSDCAMDFLDFAAFEREVRRDWNTWVNYGTGKLPADMSEGMRYAVAERQLEDLLEQGRSFAAHNKFATVYMDKALKAEAAPVLDGLRALAGLQRKGGREAEAQRTERLFDDVIAQPAMWEPTILLLREKTKAEADRGLDFVLKWQNNRIAEAMRTVGQWPLYEPVPRAEPGKKPDPARAWRGR
ncbi:XopZ family type III secretion system effector [Methylibium rhizosphaerae]|uniref:XopZ family type III secretion system effector n=1 Tax=Methylibium rhizosphaerae TaxID=2570323 RepID=UPI0011272FF0|nr:XopZ family type III secretion system effector [Methylibium rhizosphaerae]